jgi:hypothetical protein
MHHPQQVGDSMVQPSLPRVSAVILPDAWELPGKPEGGSAVVQDAYRQTTFQLGGDLRLLAEGMNLQLRVQRDAAPSKYRTHALAASVMSWSRAFLGISDAAVLVTRGSYASCPAIVRAACECLAASAQLCAEELPAFLDWLGGALHPDEEVKAIEVGMGQFFAGSTVAADPRFSEVYRAASELARPHLGAGLLLTAPESSAVRLALTFGDQSFHFGWAQLMLGWLLALCEVALRLSRSAGGHVFPIADETSAAIDAWTERVNETLARPGRAVMRLIEHGGESRWLIENFRRQSSGAPRRYLL